jgi:polysaccharide biosynthesis protein PslH
MRHILLASPIPSHPLDQGNSARIFSVGRQLQAAGYLVHFLYYQMEGLTDSQRCEMEACWDFFHPVPCQPRAMSPTGPGVYMLDDWWDPLVGAVAAKLHERWRYDAVIANYVWFSAVLNAFDRDVVKILDTHDVFGGRAERFINAGLQPEWYYTSPEQEAIGLARADVVLAIQDEEAAYFRGLGHTDVRSLGHLLPHYHRAVRGKRNRIAVGYLASGNPLNVHSFHRMRSHLLAHDTAHLRCLVAGSICASVSANAAPFEVVGRVDELEDFYDRVDLVVNPMDFGTGLKIKSVEAVFQGLPLLATKAAMVGLPIRHRFHSLDGPEELANVLANPDLLDTADLAAASHACAIQYANGVRTAFTGLLSTVEAWPRNGATRTIALYAR